MSKSDNILSRDQDQPVEIGTFEITKVDEDNRLVFGWFSVVEENGAPVVDSHNDIILIDDLEKAAYEYVLTARVGGDMHKREVAALVESMMFTRDKQVALGIDLKKVGWWGGFFVVDDEAWEMVKSGERPAFSIGGTASREEA